MGMMNQNMFGGSTGMPQFDMNAMTQGMNNMNLGMMNQFPGMLPPGMDFMGGFNNQFSQPGMGNGKQNFNQNQGNFNNQNQNFSNQPKYDNQNFPPMEQGMGNFP